MTRVRTGRRVAAMVAAFLLFAASLGAATQEELLDRARALVFESKPFVVKANDVDLSILERKPPRKEAFRLLKEARALYDRYLDANPSLEEKLDKEYVEMMVLLHGIKKDSSLGELEPEAPPAPAGGGAAPREAPAPKAAKTAKESLAALREFEKSHPGDLPQIQKLYARLLVEFPDPAQAEFVEAAESLGKVSDRIKIVFQSVAKRDFDSISGAETKDEKTVVARLSGDLAQKDHQVRKRAARLLAATRSRAATQALARGVADVDPELAKTCREGLLAIGGTSAGDALGLAFSFGPKDTQLLALSLIRSLVDRGGMEPANQSRAIGRFALSLEPDVAARAFDLLKSMGKASGPGLCVALLGTEDIDKKTSAMARMVEAKYYRGASLLAQRFLAPPAGDMAAAQLNTAATAAIEKMGPYAVPYLVDYLDGSSGRCTAMLLSRITGIAVEIGEKDKVRAWWTEREPADAE